MYGPPAKKRVSKSAGQQDAEGDGKSGDLIGTGPKAMSPVFFAATGFRRR
jgi:hypothetical protein